MPVWTWTALIGTSLLGHVSLAAALLALPAAEETKRPEMIELVDRQLPPPPPPPPPPKVIAPEKTPATPRPKPVARKKIVHRPPQPEQQTPPKPETEQREPEARRPKVFGDVPTLESTTHASTDGVQLPRGDSLRVDPAIRRRGRRQQGKPAFSTGDPAPVAAITSRPRPLSKVKPAYPQRLIQLGVGRVVLELTIDAEGKVIAIRMLRGLHPELDAAAKAAARKMRFSPAKVGDIAVQIKIPYSFAFSAED